MFSSPGQAVRGRYAARKLFLRNPPSNRARMTLKNTHLACAGSFSSPTLPRQTQRRQRPGETAPIRRQGVISAPKSKPGGSAGACARGVVKLLSVRGPRDSPRGYPGRVVARRLLPNCRVNPRRIELGCVHPRRRHSSPAVRHLTRVAGPGQVAGTGGSGPGARREGGVPRAARRVRAGRACCSGGENAASGQTRRVSSVTKGAPR
jgi:hypothetical protein